jgi:predicted nucleic-acid-binding protein
VIGLDTNVLLRYLLKDDVAQAGRAERELERGERFLIDGIVLCELV